MKDYWKQVFFGIVGLAFLAFSFFRLWGGDVIGASATYTMAFFSFIYSNITRFKRFKGLGFEAELWEDKQKEAEQLIERLKAVVTVYTRQIILGRVMAGRWDGPRWRECWHLYDELVERHSELGQNIDFADLKKDIDGVFIFDMALPHIRKIGSKIQTGHSQAESNIRTQFDYPNGDQQKYDHRHNELCEVTKTLDNMLGISQNRDLAAYILEWAHSVQKNLNDDFDVNIDFDNNAVEKLKEISRIYQGGPIKVTDDLISLAEKH